MNESKDIFIRRIYTHKGVSVAVEIDLIKKTVSLVEKNSIGGFGNKEWLFADRELKYMNGWLLILDAMKHAITEAAKVLEAEKDRDLDEMVKLMASLNNNVEKIKVANQ